MANETTQTVTDLSDQLRAIDERFQASLAGVVDEASLDAVRVAFLGRNGELTLARRRIGELPASEKPHAGKRINDVAALMEQRLAETAETLRMRALEASLTATIDVTFPGTPPITGSIHPLRRTVDEIAGYFERHGFAVVLGNEIESEYHNFDALNIPPEHPAREGLDSFYLRPGLLLRTHTSPMQIRVMQGTPPPIAIIVPGAAYRRDAVDARHSYMFHQIEGLLVAEGVHFGHLKGMLTGMCRELFGPHQAVRFRPSFFPFTEPSAEVDTTCPGCGGSGCRTCGGSGWIEIGGSGMVHPNVLREVGYDPERIAGWAFGVGVERIAMTRYGVDDIRTFFENDPAFLAQLA